MERCAYSGRQTEKAQLRSTAAPGPWPRARRDCVNGTTTTRATRIYASQTTIKTNTFAYN